MDGGGTQTRAVIVDAQGRELGRGSASSSNVQGVGRVRAMANIEAAVAQAAARAGVELPLTGAWCGLAGISRAPEQAALVPHLAALAQTVQLTIDADLVLAALPETAGVCVIAGTGSIAYGRDAGGGVARAGGWGYLLGDEGSGYDLGRRALQAIACAADGRGPATTLTEAVLQVWALSGSADLIGRVYPTIDAATVAGLASLVCTAAAAGDAVARRIVATGADALASAALAVASQLTWPAAVPLALSGGLLCGQPAYRAAVVRRVRRRLAVAPIVVVSDPALAAARALALT
ncbi:MAG TPA: BadF/BadG/BcrA/BcrD ATPase family protein [Chloroflexia bacterium]|nr:BadF/BadG/BcrA/BcrD ATPase family protein [Chloroflexia bacterium]